MSEASKPTTLVKNAIFNPSEPRHFMTITEPTQRITAKIGDLILADSRTALKVKEVGHGIYDPVIYFPRADIKMPHLANNDKTTHCPLKGDTEYFDLRPSSSSSSSSSKMALKTALKMASNNIAWSYHQTIERAAQLQNYIAFDTSKVLITEHWVSS